MTMQLIGKQAKETFTNMGWKALIDLALNYGWEPKGAEERDASLESEKDAENGVTELSEEQLQAYQVPASQPLSQILRSLTCHSGDLVLNSYFENAGFRVVAEDASAFAEPLERSLSDIPDHDAVAAKTVALAMIPDERFLPIGTPVNRFELFSGENKAHLKRFISFCKQGDFEIW